MLGDGPLLFREFAMGEALPLAIIHRAVIDFLRGRDDAVLFGAQAVNAYIDETRATQDVDVMSTRAAELAEEIREHLNTEFHIATRVRSVRDGIGFRVYQLRKPTNRHLVDVRPVDSFPPSQLVNDIQVVTPPELIANKVVALHAREGTPKSGTDWRDIAVLVLAFPELKSDTGLVADRLRAAGANDAVMAKWTEIVHTDIRAEADEDEFS